MKEQTKIKISYALRNRKKSATHSHRIAESLKGKKKTDEHKKSHFRRYEKTMGATT